MDAVLGVVIDPNGARAGALKVNRALNSIKSAATGTTSLIKSRFDSLKNTIFSLKTALAGVGIGLLGNQFLTAARTTESYRVRLNRLLGSVEEGNRLFLNMSDYAGRVAFGYDEIMQSATTLSGVLKGGTDEITDIMPLIGDLAAAYGLSMEDTTQQVVKMFSAGAQSAEMFKDRGVLAMLGFQTGVSYSAEETRESLIRAWEEPASRFRGAAKDLGGTFDGLLSMYGDAWFGFRNKVMDAGPFEFIKANLEVLLQSFKSNKEGVDAFADSIGEGLVKGFRNFTLGVAQAIDVINPAFTIVREFLDDAYEGFKQLPQEIQTYGIIVAMLFGKKGIAILALASSQVEEWKRTMQWWEEYQAGNLSFGEWLASGNQEDMKVQIERLEMMRGKIDRGDGGENKEFIQGPDKEDEKIVDSYYSKLLAWYDKVDAQQEQMSKDATSGSGGASGAGGGSFVGSLSVEKDALEQAISFSDARNKAMAEGINMYEAMRTPQELYSDQLLRIQELLFYGAIGEETASRARAIAAEELTTQLDSQNEALREQEMLVRTLEGAFSYTFNRAISEGQNLVEVLQNVAKEILNVIIQQSVIQPAANALGGYVGTALAGFANGGDFTVGGSGGTDSTLVAFKATPGETVSINSGSSNSGTGITIINQNSISVSDNREIDEKIRAGMRETEAKSYSRVVQDLKSNGPIRKMIG